MVVGIKPTQVKVPVDEMVSADGVSLGPQACAACQREKTRSEGFAERWCSVKCSMEVSRC